VNWFYLALLAPAIFTIVNYIDKYVIVSKVRDYRGMPVYGAITAIVFGTIFWLFSGTPILSLRDALLVISAGFISLIAYYLYFNALSKNETSFVIILFQVQPVFVLILSFLFLKETITAQQFIGFSLIISSAIGLSLKKDLEKIRLSSSLYTILAVDFLLAISNILIKFTIDANSFSKILSYESWGLALGGLVLYLFFEHVRKAFRESFRSVGKKVLGIMFLNEGIFIIGKAVNFLAISLGSVALVSVLGSTMTFYGILYGIILTMLAPKIFKENLTKEAISKKILFSLILLLGIYLLS